MLVSHWLFFDARIFFTACYLLTGLVTAAPAAGNANDLVLQGDRIARPWRGWAPAGTPAPQLATDRAMTWQGQPTLQAIAPTNESGTPMGGVVYRHAPVSGGELHLLEVVYQPQAGDPQAAVYLELRWNGADGHNGGLGRETHALPLQSPIRESGEGWRVYRAAVMVPADAVASQIVVRLDQLAGFHLARLSLAPEAALPIPRLATPALTADPADPHWSRAARMEHFWQPHQGLAQAAQSTEVYLSLDAESLHVLMVNTEPDIGLLKQTLTQRDAPLWRDDCNELFIALDGGPAFQLITNPGGAQWDGRLYQRADGDPWRADATWDGVWQSTARVEENRWITQWRIPFALLGGVPQPGQAWRLNFTRQRQAGMPEVSHWNRVQGALNQIEHFATLRFEDQGGVLTRYIEAANAEDPLNVERPRRLRDELLSEEPGGYRVAAWSHGFYLSDYPEIFRQQHTAESWRVEQQKLLRQRGDHGMAGPALPWGISHLGRELLEEEHRRSGMTFPFFLFGSAVNATAVKGGARYVRPIGGEGRQHVEDFDPAKFQAVRNSLATFLQRYPNIAHLIQVFDGTDEPSNSMFYTFSRSLQPDQAAMHDAVDAEIRAAFGQGRHGLFDYGNAAESVTVDAPFRRIAFVQWWNHRMARWAEQMQAMTQELAPSVPFCAASTNAVSGMAMLDIARIATHSDWISADPYPTAALASYGRARALYHPGFTTKFVHDLAGGKTTRIIGQAFIYRGRSPSPRDLYEWASQALKNGATVLDWYPGGAAIMQIPETYQAMVALNGQIHRMNRLPLPDRTGSAIFFSIRPQAARHDQALHAHYTTYTLLSERIGSWFRFVSDTQLELNQTTLEQERLIYLPQGAFLAQSTAQVLATWVEAGGHLVVLDPATFVHDEGGDSLEAIRRRVIGGRLGPRRSAEGLTTQNGALPGVPADWTLPLSPIRHQVDAGLVLAHDIDVPEDARVLARYFDGKPAAYVRSVGQGQVTFFAAQPFGNSDLAIAESAWPMLFERLAESVGESLNLPIWQFHLAP